MYVHEIKLQRVISGKIFPIDFGILSTANLTADERQYHLFPMRAKEADASVCRTPISRTTASGKPFAPERVSVKCVTVLPKKIIQLAHHSASCL